MKYNIFTVANEGYSKFLKLFINSIFDKVDLQNIEQIVVADTGLSEKTKSHILQFPKVEIMSTDIDSKYSKISDFNVSQYDEITTSHNGFLTMAVEYGAFPIVILLLMIIISVSKNLRNNYDLLIGIFLMMFIQNLTNDLIYSPDVSIYFWLIPMYFVKKLIRI